MDMNRPDLASLLVQSALSHWRDQVLLLPPREGGREEEEGKVEEEVEEEEGGREGERERPACYAEAMQWVCRLGAGASTADSSTGGGGGRGGGGRDDEKG